MRMIGKHRYGNVSAQYKRPLPGFKFQGVAAREPFTIMGNFGVGPAVEEYEGGQWSETHEIPGLGKVTHYRAKGMSPDLTLWESGEDEEGVCFEEGFVEYLTDFGKNPGQARRFFKELFAAMDRRPR